MSSEASQSPFNKSLAIRTRPAAFTCSLLYSGAAYEDILQKSLHRRRIEKRVCSCSVPCVASLAAHVRSNNPADKRDYSVPKPTSFEIPNVYVVGMGRFYLCSGDSRFHASVTPII